LRSLYPDELPFDDVTSDRFSPEGSVFCVSGDFPSGRQQAVNAIKTRGGTVEDDVCSRTDYVIVGEQPSRGWKFGNYGTKISKALELRQRGHRPLLIRESLWLTLIASLKPTEQHLDDIVERGRYRSTWVLHDFQSGFTDGWACCLPVSFRSALDIRQTLRRELGREILVWTQGGNFDFSEGDTLFDSRDAYEKPWAEALQTMRFALQVKNVSENIVAFDILEPNDVRSALVVHEHGRATMLEFIRLLITGSCKKHQ
jgi:hypothetical protein